MVNRKPKRILSISIKNNNTSRNLISEKVKFCFREVGNSMKE